MPKRYFGVANFAPVQQGTQRKMMKRWEDAHTYWVKSQKLKCLSISRLEKKKEEEEKGRRKGKRKKKEWWNNNKDLMNH